MTIASGRNYFNEHAPQSLRPARRLARGLPGNLATQARRRSADATHRLLLIEAWSEMRRGNEYCEIESMLGKHVKNLTPSEYSEVFCYIVANRKAKNHGQ